MKPFFSIIIAAYNSEKTISKTLNSLVNQDFPAWEAIIVNDNSVDSTLDVVSDFVGNDSRFRLISLKDNLGP